MLHLCLSLRTVIVCYQWTEAWGVGGGGGGGGGGGVVGLQ